jgi:RNA polymerase-binding protein DksA
MSTPDKALRQRLLDERERISAALEYLHVENAGSMRDESEETTTDNHLAETASVTLDREIDYSLEGASSQVLAEIDDALARMDAGTYGVCVTCGSPIGADRLEAIPWARQCIGCRRQEERG